MAHDTLLSTWVRATFHPAALNANRRDSPRRLGPIAFALMVSAVVMPAVAFIDALFEDRTAAAATATALGWLIASPILTLVQVYPTAAFTHFWLFVARGNKGTFRNTLAATCYARGPLVFQVVPVLGTAVGLVWYVVALCIGLKHAHRTSTARAVFAGLATMVGPVLLALGLRAGVVEAFRVPSRSMLPTLGGDHGGEHILVNKHVYGPFIPGTEARLFSRLPPKRGDVIVFRFPENKAQDFVKRVIAVPGDTLEVINGRPVLNGTIVPHCKVGPYPYEHRSAELFVEFLGDNPFLTIFDSDPDEQRCSAGDCGTGLECRAGICGRLQGPFRVHPGEVWVMGDNRDNSHDSRSWGGGVGAGVPFENIKGRASIVWMSSGPDGSVVKSRLFFDIHGQPELPPGHAELMPALARCLREGPSLQSSALNR